MRLTSNVSKTDLDITTIFRWIIALENVSAVFKAMNFLAAIFGPRSLRNTITQLPDEKRLNNLSSKFLVYEYGSVGYAKGK
jgi:hypothetical protein